MSLPAARREPPRAGPNRLWRPPAEADPGPSIAGSPSIRRRVAAFAVLPPHFRRRPAIEHTSPVRRVHLPRRSTYLLAGAVVNRHTTPRGGEAPETPAKTNRAHGYRPRFLHATAPVTFGRAENESASPRWADSRSVPTSLPGADSAEAPPAPIASQPKPARSPAASRRDRKSVV